MIYNAMDVANFIINKCYEMHNPISNLQLQKILYFAWIGFYEITGRSLFGDIICAWQFGPVVPEVYYEYCAYGGRPINIKCETDIKSDDQSILSNIVDKYVDIPVYVLVNMTHRAGGAWDTIFSGGEGNRQVIPFELIKAKECDRQHVSR